jgi:hypothetical protein
MGKGSVKSMPSLGFLTIVEHPQYGLFGGYLVLNTAGRPLEFHCTAPIKPNRAQEILYGPTLESFLYGEQIGQTLLKQASAETFLVCTNRPAALATREFVATPMALVLEPGSDGENAKNTAAASGENATGENFAVSSAADANNQAKGSVSGSSKGKFFRIDSAHRGGPRLITFQLGRNRLAVSEQVEADRQQIADSLGDLANTFDLNEPFERIREAIEEAQQAVR